MFDYDQQIKEADQDVRSRTASTGWISKPDKFQITAELTTHSGVLLNTYEWGESREEIYINHDDAVQLHEWLTTHLKKGTE